MVGLSASLTSFSSQDFLHAVATGNLLPASVPTVCVDVNPAVPTKLADRGTFQAVGVVMDAASFLMELGRELGWAP